MRTFTVLAALLLASFVTPAALGAAPVVTITATGPVTGKAGYTSGFSWSVTGATSCFASGAWTGSKPVTGTQAVTVSAAATYSLTCHASDAVNTVSWTPPTKNDDGTTLTNLDSYGLYRGVGATTPTKLKTVPGAGVTSTTDSGLATGTYRYAVSAINADGVESILSTVVSTNATASTDTESVAFAVQAVPNPPTGVTVTNAVAYEIRLNSQGVLVASRIGLISQGSICTQETREVDGVTYNRVDPSSVDLINWPAQTPPKDVFARCAEG
jgi:hypothetical protein